MRTVITGLSMLLVHSSIVVFLCRQARLKELEKDRDVVDMERALLEKRKNEAEQPEKEAKERHEKQWEGNNM